MNEFYIYKSRLNNRHYANTDVSFSLNVREMARALILNERAFKMFIVPGKINELSVLSVTTTVRQELFYYGIQRIENYNDYKDSIDDSNIPEYESLDEIETQLIKHIENLFPKFKGD